ncbi:MAG: replicative DNA helicase [Marmoricola sp.]
MSQAEIDRPDQFNNPFGEDHQAYVGRVPPQDVEAEQSVLGSMLLSKDAIADATENLAGADFYKPAHETIFDAIMELYGRGEPVDPITVAAELTRRGDIAKMGGAPYLHTLTQMVPIASNAGYYAELVREKAILRRLVDAGTRIAQMGYSGEGQVDDTVDRAQAEIYSISEKRQSEDYLPLSAIMESTLDEIEAISNRDGSLHGVPTGLADLDELTNGFTGGQMIIVAARPAMGKALALDTPLVTPTGWTTMGEVAVGDQLFGADGKPTRVVAATEVMHGRPCYEVVFSDGSRIIADEEHQWLTETRAARKSAWAAERNYNRSRNQCIKPAVVTTREIASTVRLNTDRRANHAVLNALPLQCEGEGLPLSAYVLGAWLGDGHSASARLTSETDEIPEIIRSFGVRCEPRAGYMLHSLSLEPGDPRGSVQAVLRTMGVLNNKHIPMAYLRAPEAERRALLAGLLDTDGTIVRNGGSVQLALTHERLAMDAWELIVSLGYKCTHRTKLVKGRSKATSTAHLLTFSSVDPVFWLRRKAELHASAGAESTSRIGRRYITEVREIDSVPVRCVEVESADHLYLAGSSMIPTHNSTLGLDFCRAASIGANMTSVFFSLEMSKSEITTRLLAAEARVALNHMRNGPMTEDDWAKLVPKMGQVSGAPMFIDDSPNLTMMEIRSKARRLKQRHDLRLIVIDYLQLMSSGKKVESRQLEVSEFSRQIKLLAKELDVPIIALSQLNRGPEQRSDKRPMMSDLRESGCLTADTRLLRADNNAEVTLGELMSGGESDVPVWALDDRLKLVPRTLTHAFSSGTKEVFDVTLASGRRVQATANHPFLTYDGWMPLRELLPGARVGAVRHVPPPMEVREWDDYEVVLLAHMIGDGSFVKRQPIRYASTDEACLQTVAWCARNRFGITAKRDDYPAARVTTLRLPAPYKLARGRRNPIAAWLDELGLFGLRSHEKFVPAGVFGLTKAQVGLFLRNLWATDGSIQQRADGSGHIYYATTSRRLADDVANLLMRYNVFSRIKTAHKPGYRDTYHVCIYGAENQLRFCEEIGAHGARGQIAERLCVSLREIKSNTNVDTVPVEVWEDVSDILRDQGMAHREFAEAMGTSFSGSTMWRHAPSRERLHKVATVLADADLDVVATNDVFWDSIKSIEPAGVTEVYDATVLGVHNFIANGICLHNSLEQDADIVMLLHREDVYEKESQRPGEADIIVAKHRNGPTRDIAVLFQGHYSRFVDMAH